MHTMMSMMMMVVGASAAPPAPAPKRRQLYGRHRLVPAERIRLSGMSGEGHEAKSRRTAHRCFRLLARDESAGELRAQRLTGCRARRTRRANGFSAGSSAYWVLTRRNGQLGGLAPAAHHAARCSS